MARRRELGLVVAFVSVMETVSLRCRVGFAWNSGSVVGSSRSRRWVWRNGEEVVLEVGSERLKEWEEACRINPVRFRG